MRQQLLGAIIDRRNMPIKEWLFLLASCKTTATSISSSHVAVFVAIFLCEDDVTFVLLTYCRSGWLVGWLPKKVSDNHNYFLTFLFSFIHFIYAGPCLC